MRRVKSPNSTTTTAKSAVKPEAQHVVSKTLLHDSFREMWEGRYQLVLPDIRSLIRYPKKTLGYQYAAHVLQSNISTKFYPYITPSSVDEYISLLTKQTHELWHVVTGFDTTPHGEAALQAFYTAQTGSPLSAELVAMGLLNVAQNNGLESARLLEMISEAYQQGLKSKFLLGVRWEHYLDFPLSDVRTALGL